MTHPEEMIGEQRITFASKAENISIVEKLVNDICAAYHVSEDYYGNILVALTEAANNAIYHGNKSDESKQVEIEFSSSEDTLTFTIRDQGPGFNPDILPDPTNPENIEKPNGRGVFLMRHLADSVTFENEGRSVSLSFALNKA
jgi:serine/threonine-protein kinase RsbW